MLTEGLLWVLNLAAGDIHSHYGLRASRNQLIRSGHVRDQMSRKHDVPYFVMEGAGVMNTFLYICVALLEA